MKKIIIVLSFLLVFNLQIFPIIEETASFSDFLFWQADSCEYDNWISHLTEGIAREGWNTYAPYDVQTTGFGSFRLPESEQLDDWETVIGSFLIEDYENAQTLIDTFLFPYKVIEFDNTENGLTYYLLRENLNMAYYDDNETPQHEDDEHGSFDYGWGLYVYNPMATQPVIITVPHPTDDFIAPVIAYECFKDWDAMFLLINGAGREVVWTEAGSYNNSKSLSDPSRNENHPFHVAYKLFCDKIRNDFGHREFSAQIHSYDWDRHAGYANCQVSAGGGQTCPNLPIRDLSDLKIDLINFSDHHIIPENTIGNNSDVFLNDFYAVYYNIYDFTFSDEDTTLTVNNSVDLPGYGQNKQMQYTFSGWNSYDVFEPFFHLEMDELPNSYEITEENYNWFYAFNEITEIFDMEHLFDLTKQYYSFWINSLTEVLPYVFELDDYQVPETPENFSIENLVQLEITVSWDGISSFDFYTYEIFYGIQPIDEGNYNVYSRIDDDLLASPLADEITFEDLEINRKYYFKIRAQDYNNNFSGLSDEISATTGPVIVSDLYVVGLDESATLGWIAVEQNENNGFIVYRRYGLDNFIMIDSWETNPALAGSTHPNIEYEFEDHDLENGEYYTYRIACENIWGSEYSFVEQVVCSPRPIYWLVSSNMDRTIKDSVAFSTNLFANDNFDPYYDIPRTDSTTFDYIFSAFYEEEWREMFLVKETHRFYNLQTSYKTWNYSLKTDQYYEPIEIYVSPNYFNRNEHLFLEDPDAETIVDLADSSFVFLTDSSEFTDFMLYWGNWLPTLDTPDNLLIFIENGIVHLSWAPVLNADFYNVYSSPDPYLVFEMDNSGTFAGTSWQAPVPDEIRFYYITADH